jgi:carbonic anhydrase
MTGLVEQILERNRLWSDACIEQDPEFFSRLTSGQAPQCLWIGCADSRVPVTKIAGFEPGDVFVHRNIANLVLPGDESALSVLEFAVDVLQVTDVIVCGHSRCGGVAAAEEGKTGGHVGDWLRQLGELADHLILDEGVTRQERLERLTELNVLEQVRHVEESEVVRRARGEGRAVRIQGLMYDMGVGRLRRVERKNPKRPPQGL